MSFKLNMGFIKACAKRVEEKKRRASEYGSKFTYFKFSNGENVIRVGPPWNTLGENTIEIHKHWIGKKPLGVALNNTYSGLEIVDPIDVAVQEIGRYGIEIPGYKKSSQISCNLLDRSHMELEWQVATLPNSVGNWIGTNQNTVRLADLSDPFKGVDVIVVKHLGRDSNNRLDPMNNSYEISNDVDRTPVHPDEDEIAKLLGDILLSDDEFEKKIKSGEKLNIGKLNDLYTPVYDSDNRLISSTGVYAVPTDKRLAELYETANRLLTENGVPKRVTDSGELVESKSYSSPSKSVFTGRGGSQKTSRVPPNSTPDCYGKFHKDGTEKCSKCNVEFGCITKMNKRLASEKKDVIVEKEDPVNNEKEHPDCFGKYSRLSTNCLICPDVEKCKMEKSGGS